MFEGVIALRDFAYFAHIILGVALIVLSLLVLLELRKKAPAPKALSIAAAIVGWLMLLPSGILYTTFYPATKSLVKAGAWPWAHSILMETKEHWGLLIPIIATVAAGLALSGRAEESRKWWVLLAVTAALVAVMGRIVKMGAGM